MFRVAVIEARALSIDALLAEMQVLASDLEDPDPDWPGEAGRWLASERLRAYEAELERKTRIISLPESQAATYAQHHDAWVDLARVVREAIPVPEVLLLVGCPPTRTGTRRSGETEHHGPCPRCGGRDRLVSWDGPRSRCWCRQCDWRADAIRLIREHYPGCRQFRDAVRMLARLASLTGAQP